MDAKAGPRPEIAIVGAGFSGVLTALNVLETPGSRARVHLIQEASRFGVGAAYGATQPDHLLNVRASNMSADPDEPDDFVLWLAQRRGAPPAPFAFASRSDYGAYLQSRLRRAAQRAVAADRLDLIQDSVIAINRMDEGFALDLAMGRSIGADVVVLATGNAPPSLSVLPHPAIADYDRYVGDPWTPGALDGIEADEPILLLGSGLTMVDVMASLDARGHEGPVLALSRRGLPPQRHAPTEANPSLWRPEPGEALSARLGRFRRAVRRGGDWRALFDSLRTQTQALWQGLSLHERRRFLHRLRPYWDSHRHRLAPQMADRLDGWLTGRLRIEAGRLESLDPAGDQMLARWKPPGQDVRRRRLVGHVINCTGPEGNPNESRSPLVRQLVAAGLVRADALGLGMDVTQEGRVIGADGAPSQAFFTIGPAARGALWEVTAVPDLRIQARQLGRLLAQEGRDHAPQPFTAAFNPGNTAPTLA